MASSSSSSSSPLLLETLLTKKTYTNEEIDVLVQQRVTLRWERRYVEADVIRINLEETCGIEICDIPLKQGGGSYWRRRIVIGDTIDNQSDSHNNDNNNDTKDKSIAIKPKNLLDLAHHAYEYLHVQKVLSEEQLVSMALQLLSNSMKPRGSSDTQLHTVTTQSATAATEEVHTVTDAHIDTHLDSVETVFKLSTRRDMQGRKFADAAFTFALSGIRSTNLFEALIRGASEELTRCGHRKSCRSVDIYQVVEKLAVAGCCEQSLFAYAADLLEKKYYEQTSSCGAVTSTDKQQQLPRLPPQSLAALRSGQYNLLSDRPLLCLWRYASRQKKKGNQFTQDDGEVANDDASDDANDDVERDADADADADAAADEEKEDTGEQTSECDNGIAAALPSFDNLFADPTLPLVIDVGCGYGVSAIGLAYWQQLQASSDQCQYQRVNVLGCDLSHRAVGYATSIIQRWKLSPHCAVLYAEAGQCLQHVITHYPGPVIWISVNFPTPYKLEYVYPQCKKQTNNAVDSNADAGDDAAEVHPEKKAKFDNDIIGQDDFVADADLESPAFILGNGQLPKNLDTFMFSAKLVELCRLALSKPSSTPDSNSEDPWRNRRILYLQSNAEDVLLTMTKLIRANTQLQQQSESLPQPVFHQWKEDSECLRSVGGLWESLVANSFHESTHHQSMMAQADIDGCWAEVDPSAHSQQAPPQRLSQRDERWMTTFPQDRARGPGYLKHSPLPSLARTETEAAGEVEHKMVHRSVFYI
jgi:SAM-dependent methyltransferase